MGFNTLGALWKLGTGRSIGSAISTGLGFEPVLGSSDDYNLVESLIDNSTVGSALNNALGNSASDESKAIQNRTDEMNYNSEEAEKQRLFELYLSNTAYSRAIADLQRNGINPYVVLSGLSGASTPSGASASYSGYASAYLSSNASMRNARLGVVNSAISALARLARLGTISILRS